MSNLMHNRNGRMIMIAVSMLALVAMACTCGGVTDLLPSPTATPAPVIAPPPQQPSSGSTGGGVSLFIINNSGLEICYLYVSPTTSDSWGDDQLGSDTIPTGTTYELFDVPAGNYDLRAEACDGVNYAENFGADLTGDFEWTITP